MKVTHKNCKLVENVKTNEALEGQTKVENEENPENLHECSRTSKSFPFLFSPVTWMIKLPKRICSLVQSTRRSISGHFILIFLPGGSRMIQLLFLQRLTLSLPAPLLKIVALLKNIFCIKFCTKSCLKYALDWNVGKSDTD